MIIILIIIATLTIPQSRHYIHERFFSLDDLIGMNDEQLKLSAEYNKTESILKFEKSIHGAWKLKHHDKSVDSKMMIRTQDHKVDFFTDGTMEESYTWKLFADVGDDNKPIYKFTYVELDSTETIEVKGDSLLFTDVDTEGKPVTTEYVRINTLK